MAETESRQAATNFPALQTMPTTFPSLKFIFQHKQTEYVCSGLVCRDVPGWNLESLSVGGLGPDFRFFISHYLSIYLSLSLSVSLAAIQI